MRRILTLLPFTLLFVVQLFGQDQPVPGYVVNQDFPDSVKAVPMVTLEGGQATFADMLKTCRGKKVVIDIWASWCRDCIAGLPKLDQLRKQTEGDKVVYVFLSVDDDDQKWRSAIKRFDIRGVHYRIKAGWRNPLANYIVLDWVPRYLTLSEDGRVMMPKAILANDRLLVRSVLD